MSELSLLLASEIGLLVLACTRLTGLVIAAPLGWDFAPVRVRGVLVIMTALAVHGLHPRALAGETLTVIDWFLLVTSEFLLGLGMGFVVRILIGIAEIAAESFAPNMGLGAAQIFDPQSSASFSVMTLIFKYLAILLALILGVHRVLLAGVMGSFRVAPLGSVDQPGGAAEPLLRLVANSINAGVRIAVPVLALLFITQVALAFISRAAPAMQIFAVGFAVTLAVGAIALILVLPDIGRELLVEMSYVGRQLEQVAGAMLSR